MQRLTFDHHKTYKIDLSGQIKFGPIEENDLYEIFKDGRVAGLIIEHLLNTIFKNLTRLGHENAALDFIDNDARRYEARTVTKNGVKFIPSHMIGQGRKFSQAGFVKKLSRLESFILLDITQCPVFIITSVSANDPKILKKELSYKAFRENFLPDEKIEGAESIKF